MAAVSSENPSSLNVNALPFSAGLPREQRPTLRSLRTGGGRELTAFDAVPFTPSQGVITPSPHHTHFTLNGGHYDPHLHMYSFTPQGPHLPGPFEEGHGLQSISEESSGNSFNSTISPFHWGMPVSPSAFPVRQENFMAASGLPTDGVPLLPQLSGLMPLTTQDFMYGLQLPLQPGSPVYFRPGSPMMGGMGGNATWNNLNLRRQPSRLGPTHQAGNLPASMYLMPQPGSPGSVYPQAAITNLDFAQALSMNMIYPMPGSPATSPRWQPSVNMGMPPFPMQPPTPPRSGLYSAGSHGFRGMGPMPAHLPTGGDRSTSGSLSDGHCHPLGGLGGGGTRHVHVHAGTDGQPPMNARQRRTARRKAEREAKMVAEAEAASGERIAAHSSQPADKVALPAGSFGSGATPALE